MMSVHNFITSLFPQFLSGFCIMEMGELVICCKLEVLVLLWFMLLNLCCGFYAPAVMESF